jgi:hypothetical protein
MTPPEPAAAERPAVIPAAAALPIWRAVRAQMARHRAEGGHVRPEVAAALEELRAAALAHMCVPGQPERTSGHAEARDRPVTTAELAARLGVTGFHVRRLAAAAGIRRVARGLWAPEDADRLTAQRKARA